MEKAKWLAPLFANIGDGIESRLSVDLRRIVSIYDALASCVPMTIRTEDMVDHLTPKKRSELMSRIRGRNNRSTEMRLLGLLKKEAITGWRRHLPFPGRPDFAFPKQRMLIFVDGDFWHGNPRTFKRPKSNAAFWTQKVERNRIRDREVSRLLRKRGWIVLRIWESDLRRNPDRCMARIKMLLGADLT